MKTKLDRVFQAVVATVGNSMTRFDAAEAAQYLLKKSNGNVAKAIEMAKTPFKIQGKFTY